IPMHPVEQAALRQVPPGINGLLPLFRGRKPARSGESLADINAAALCLGRMSFITDIAAAILASTLVITLAVFGVGALIERLAPAEGAQPRAHVGINIAYTAAFAAILHVMKPAGAAIGVAIVNALG